MIESSRIALPATFAHDLIFGRIGERGLEEFNLLDPTGRQLAGGIDTAPAGLAAIGKRQIEIATQRIDHQIVDSDVSGTRGQRLGDACVEAGDIELRLGGVALGVAGVDGKQGEPLVSPTKRMPSGPKASEPADLEIGAPLP